MDEARLVGIEEDARHAWEMLQSERGKDVLDLISSLRTAWRERDELVAHVQWLTPINEIVERAARAEAEVKRLEFYVKMLESRVPMHGLGEPARTEFDRLRQVREAAEEVIRHLGPSSNPWSNFSGEAYEAVIRLRRALSACAKDPAR